MIALEIEIQADESGTTRDNREDSVAKTFWHRIQDTPLDESLLGVEQEFANHYKTEKRKPIKITYIVHV